MAARAILIAQMVDDPGGERGWHAGKKKAVADKEREDIFDLIREITKWDNLNNKELLDKANKLIRESWERVCDQTGEDRNNLPPFLEPFSGRGVIPLEAFKLGLETNACDLNPIPFIINKFLIDVPYRFLGRGSIGNSQQRDLDIDTVGLKGIEDDVKYFGNKVINEAREALGSIFPEISLSDVGGSSVSSARVVSWIWARTVKTPNPAFPDRHIPLIGSYVLSSKKGIKTWLEPIVDGGDYKFKIVVGDNPPKNSGTIGRKGALCLLSDIPIPLSYIREEV